MNTKTLFVVFSVLLISMLATTVALAESPTAHRVSAGGPDLCAAFGVQPGCDASFSLHAREFADGSVSGQYTDQFGGGFGGLHAVIDCLYVDGNDAWVSGVITQDTFSGDGSFVGTAISARVKDNGTSANDPPDQISFSQVGESAFNCTDHPDIDLYDAPQGQIIVR